MPIQQKLPPPVLLFRDFAGWEGTVVVGLRLKLPHFFEDSEHHISLFGSLFLSCFFYQKFFVFTQKMYRNSFFKNNLINKAITGQHRIY